VRGDLTCAGVAAASVLAKCERDAIMVDLGAQQPEYGWALNKGYSAPDHIEALRRHGPTSLHRQSWNLPGTQQQVGTCQSEVTKSPGAAHAEADLSSSAVDETLSTTSR